MRLEGIRQPVTIQAMRSRQTVDHVKAVPADHLLAALGKRTVFGPGGRVIHPNGKEISFRSQVVVHGLSDDRHLMASRLQLPKQVDAVTFCTRLA